MKILTEGGDYNKERLSVRRLFKITKHILTPLSRGVFLYELEEVASVKQPLERKALVCFDKNNFTYNKNLIRHFGVTYLISRVSFTEPGLALKKKIKLKPKIFTMLSLLTYAILGKYREFEKLLSAHCARLKKYQVSELLFTNDQTPFSGLILHSIGHRRSATFQHGIINQPGYYFPVKTDHFFCWEKGWEAKLGPKKVSIGKYIMEEGWACGLEETNSLLIATHSITSLLKCLWMSRKKNTSCSKIYVKVHPTTKFLLINQLIIKIHGAIEFKEPVDARTINKFDGIITEFSTLAVDFRFTGKSVSSFLKQAQLPEYMKSCIGPSRDVSLMRALEEKIYLYLDLTPKY